MHTPVSIFRLNMKISSPLFYIMVYELYNLTFFFYVRAKDEYCLEDTDEETEFQFIYFDSFEESFFTFFDGDTDDIIEGSDSNQDRSIAHQRMSDIIESKVTFKTEGASKSSNSSFYLLGDHSYCENPVQSSESKKKNL